MNIVLVSHCSFQGNSALHVYSISKELYRRGHRPLICVPAEPETVFALGDPPFPVLSYCDARDQGVRFPDGKGPALIHAFSPREQVRKLVLSLCERYQCPYLVHLEDNEEAIVDDELVGLSFRDLAGMPATAVERWIKPWRTHPQRARSFLSGAAGVTALIDRLLELKPPGVPGTVFWPGFDPRFAENSATPIDFRRRLGLSDRDLILVYTGDVHHSNLAEVRSLFLAVGLLRRAGFPALLLKTGWNRVDMDWVRECGLQDWAIDLGYLPRADVPALLRAADILVQPGGPNRFNDYRFPSKLPEFLVSGKPVILPHSNIGRFLRDGEEAFLLDRGDAVEIFEKVSLLAANEETRTRLGDGGRHFALRRLTWTDNVERILALYAQARSEDTRASATRYCRAVSDERRAVPRPKLIVFCARTPNRPASSTASEADESVTASPASGPSLPSHQRRREDVARCSSTNGKPGARVAEVATACGVYGFCYFYSPVHRQEKQAPSPPPIAAIAHPGIPFCLCLANAERAAAGGDRLKARDPSSARVERLIRDLLPVLGQENYIRVGGAPLLLISQVEWTREAAGIAERWREIAREEAALDLHLAAAASNRFDNPIAFGMDAVVELPPLTKAVTRSVPREPDTHRAVEDNFRDYLEQRNQLLGKRLPDHPFYRCAMPYWGDTETPGLDTPSQPESWRDAYREWLRRLTAQTLGRARVQEPFVFAHEWCNRSIGIRSYRDGNLEAAWLETTRDAVCEGIRTYWAIKGIRITQAEALDELRLAGSFSMKDR
ncbi:MAG: glycoside hydrolase family 99-like domain-containing protein [Chromatiaceae bacterium]|nr:glycoside hydrolase family 99-like domain-containing protein [Chromatiaceae bacterium]